MSKILAKNLLFRAFRGPLAIPALDIAAAGRCSSNLPSEVTHTGQVWAPDDYRNARFVGRPKHVNPNFAIDLIAEVPPKACKERVVWCDGGGGPVGHPKVFINLDKPGNHSCGYCGLRFFLDGSHH